MAQTCRPNPHVNRKSSLHFTFRGTGCLKPPAKAACTFLTKQNVMKNKVFLLYGLAALAATLFQLALLRTAQSSVLAQAALWLAAAAALFAACLHRQAAPHRTRVYTRKFLCTAGKYAAAACGIFLVNAFLAFGAGAGEMSLADAQRYAALSECLWPLCHFWLAVLLCLDARQLRHDDFQAA